MSQSSVDVSHITTSHEITLLSLPNELLFVIFKYLTPGDIINLSSIDRNHRNRLIPVIFLKVKQTWQDLKNEINGTTNFLIKYKRWIHELRICDCDASSEWDLDIFSDLLIDMSSLQHLSINSPFSSNWLKYRSHDNLQKLTLYFDPSYLTESEIKSKMNRVFNLNHIANFKVLKQLELHNYQLYGDEKNYPVLILEDITLVDCTWEYPFELSLFNYNENIKKLTLKHSGNNPFIVSERYKHFLTKESFGSLEEMEISFTEGANLPDMRSSFILNVLNKNRFPELGKLTIGFPHLTKVYKKPKVM
ncbi:hypothetical protein SBY92_000301 [Candida maltosa Xu316]|uniref:F-box domain-containing protein n=1 Tax=Candida maltosa (strain Xu316) TaxID=1245528 RepID=M3K517_CANMX|nr:hypothetical protein G210_4591 [Candida maltosa Xu316]